MAQDIPQTNWSQYFDSGQNFGNWFNSDFNQQQKLKFEQVRAIIDDEMQRQRLGQQQQQITQTGDYYKQLGQEAIDRQKEINRHNKVSETPDTTPDQDKLAKTLYQLISPTGGRAAIGPAYDAVYGANGTPEQKASYLGMAQKVPGSVPDTSMQGMPPGMTPTAPGMVSPPPEQSFLPGVGNIQEKEAALEEQRRQRTQLLKVQGDKLVQAMQIAGQAATLKNDLTVAQTQWTKLRTQEQAVEGPWKRFMDGENLKVKQANVAIGQMRNQIYGQSVTQQGRTQAIGQAKQSRQIMNTELGRTQTEQRMLEKEKDNLQTTISKANSIMVAADSLAQRGDPSLQASRDYAQASALIDQLRGRVAQINPRLKELGDRATSYRNLLNLLPDQQQVSPSGTVKPVSPNSLRAISPQAAQSESRLNPPGKILQMKDGTKWQRDASGKWNKL